MDSLLFAPLHGQRKIGMWFGVMAERRGPKRAKSGQFRKRNKGYAQTPGPSQVARAEAFVRTARHGHSYIKPT
jgi:hypothetical protein